MSKMATKEPQLTRREVELQRIAQVEQLAAKAFAQHEIKALWVALPFDGACELGVNAWRCAKPGDCSYAFTLYAVPGRLIVCGDIGTLVVERTYDMLAWARGAIDSIDYFASKVVSEIRTKEYDPDMVRALATEMDRDIIEGEHEYDGKIAKAWLGDGVRAELLGVVDDGEHEVARVIHESGLYDGCDYPDFEN